VAGLAEQAQKMRVETGEVLDRLRPLLGLGDLRFSGKKIEKRLSGYYFLE